MQPPPIHQPNRGETLNTAVGQIEEIHLDLYQSAVHTSLDLRGKMHSSSSRGQSNKWGGGETGEEEDVKGKLEELSQRFLPPASITIQVPRKKIHIDTLMYDKIQIIWVVESQVSLAENCRIS